LVVTGAAIALLVLVGVGLVWQQVRLVGLRYEMRENQAIIHLHDPEIERLRARVAELGSPARLRKLAKQLGLVVPESDQIVYVVSGSET